MRRVLFALACSALGLPGPHLSSSLAQESGAAAAMQGQPEDVRLYVETETGKTRFRLGEIIPLKLSFTSSSTKKYQINMATYDGSGRMSYEQFLAEPQSGVSDPLRAYFAYGGFIMGGLTGFRFLSAEPTVVPLDLNEWVRFDRAGTYTLRVVSRRVSELADDKSYAGANTVLVSNELRLNIVPATSTWQSRTLDTAVSSPNKGGLTPMEREKEIQRRLKVLRFLGTPESTKELARRFEGRDPNVDFQCMFGLVGSRYRDVALTEMRRLLVSSDHPVTSMFVRTMVVLKRNPAQPTEQLAEDEKRNAEATRNQLLEAVSHKRGKALALTLNTVLETTGYERKEGNAVNAQLAARIAAVFDQLPVEKQREILENRWESVKDPAFLPVLRKYALQYRDFPVQNETNAYTSLHMTGAALQRWYELEPAEARRAVIQEILRPKPRYSARVLGILPDKTLPEVERLLAEHFAAQEDGDGAENLASLVERYATDSVLADVLPVLDKSVGRWACAIQPPILAYLLRVSPDLARPRIEAAMAARGSGYSACNHSLLVDVANLREDPILEEIAVRSLDDDDPEVSGNAAEFLRRHGSHSTEEALRTRLTRWSEEWQGREQELRYIPGESNPNVWQKNLGANLVHALAKAKSWLADEGKLTILRQLAVSSNEREELDRMISEWADKPWGISHYRVGDQIHFQVLQYESVSIQNFEQKLAQFPRGSAFFWGDSGAAAEEEDKIFDELSGFLTNHGMNLVRSAR